MKKVTFKTIWKLKNELREDIIIEYTEASDDMIKLRAMALNWILVSIEVVK